MIQFIIFNLLLIAVATLVQFGFADSEAVSLGENLVLIYVSYLIYFAYFLTASVFYNASEQAERPFAEKLIVFSGIAPYLALSWRFKYSMVPISSNGWLLLTVLGTLTLWFLDRRNIADYFQRVAEMGVGERPELLPGRNKKERYTNMRIIAVILALLPIPFWQFKGVFVG